MQVLSSSQLQWQQECLGHSACCCCRVESQDVLLGWEGLWPCPDHEPQNSSALLCGRDAAVFRHPWRDVPDESHCLQLPAAVHTGVCLCVWDRPTVPSNFRARCAKPSHLSFPVTHLHLSFPQIHVALAKSSDFQVEPCQTCRDKECLCAEESKTFMWNVTAVHLGMAAKRDW